MKKEYMRPELSILSLVVEDNTNALDITINTDDNELSIGGDILGGIFG
ncbi:MAG: hypothetical protein U0M42_09630 [Acutalibacteraceae bacterium]|nr:hypothetical protein [Acutalibacteraceae bacterium]